MWLAIILGSVLLLVASSARAAQVRLPLRISYLILDEALKKQLFTAPGGRALFWSGSDPCQYFYAENPRFGPDATTVKLETVASLSLGLSVGGKCLSPVSWNGIIELHAQPYVTSDLILKLRVTDINLYNLQHEKTLLAGRAFDLIKGNFIPRIETFYSDLKTPVRQLGELAQSGAPSDVAQRVRAALSTLRAIAPVVAEDNGLRVMVEIIVPNVPTPVVSGPPAQLTSAEIAAWQKALDQWDAFFVFATKQVGITVRDKQVRDQLFNLLVDSRYRLVQALSHPQPSNGPDPVRLLFLDTWNRFDAIVQSAAGRGVLGNRMLEFLSFISAGDALFALDQAAPALGVRVSADGLRRLAHVMAPKFTADPLKYSFDEDSELRQIFGTAQPLESPGPLEEPEADVSPGGALQTPTMTPMPSPTLAPLSSLRRWLLDPPEAFAAADPLIPQILSLGQRLKALVVNDSNASSYRDAVDRLLGLSAQREMNDDALESAYRRIYLVMVKSTAWQESCWRQFVIRHDRIRWLESVSGDIGLMQINKYVWRGFYGLPRLKWDIVYNVSAGEEILMQMMRHATNKGATQSSGHRADLARSAYSAYNGGPGAWNRWRRHNAPNDVRHIDEAFWEKYQALEQGQSFDILRCAAEWEQPHRPAH